ncbi:MAG: hypothetical protein JNM88_15580 [Chitinophagaceae bacterium]|nr:hypothetical protein [Chitinophagaceae bacterium]
MNLLGVILTIVFAATAISSFYFWQKGQRIILKYFSWREVLTNPLGFKKRVPPDEWKQFKTYSRYQAFCFFGGVMIMLLLFVIQWRFRLFVKTE